MGSDPIYPVQRRDARYPLSLPLTVTLNSKNSVQLIGKTENISSRGVLFSAKSVLPFGSSIKLEVSLPGKSGRSRVAMEAKGTIVRISEQQGRFVVAVGCEAPFQIVRRKGSKSNFD